MKYKTELKYSVCKEFCNQIKIIIQMQNKINLDKN